MREEAAKAPVATETVVEEAEDKVTAAMLVAALMVAAVV